MLWKSEGWPRVSKRAPIALGAALTLFACGGDGGSDGEPCPSCAGVVVQASVMAPALISFECPTGFVLEWSMSESWGGPYPDASDTCGGDEDTYEFYACCLPAPDSDADDAGRDGAGGG